MSKKLDNACKTVKVDGCKIVVGDYTLGRDMYIAAHEVTAIMKRAECVIDVLIDAGFISDEGSTELDVSRVNQDISIRYKMEFTINLYGNGTVGCGFYIHYDAVNAAILTKRMCEWYAPANVVILQSFYYDEDENKLFFGDEAYKKHADNEQYKALLNQLPERAFGNA